MLYASPNSPGAKLAYKPAYDNFIGGNFVPPVKGQYFDVITPITGKVYTKAARSGAADIDLALDAAHAAAPKWGAVPPAERANVLLKIADRMEQNLELLAYAETVDNGKPIRETLNADIPLAIDHFRYFAGCVRAQEGGFSQIDDNTIAYHFHEPLGVVGQIIPWNFPILMAAWKLAPAIAAGNCVVLKPAESTPISILVMAELIADLLPPGVLNIVNGYRPRSRHAAGHQQAHRQDRVHRLHRHRPRHRAGGGQQPDSGDAGTRRQEPERLLRRRAGGRR